MNLPEFLYRNRLYEIDKTVITRPRKKMVDFYHRKLTWWLNVYGIRFKYTAVCIILKKTCI